MAADIKLSDCLIAPHSQLCWDCANACGGCSWSGIDPVTHKPRFEPVPGWKAKPTRTERSTGMGRKKRVCKNPIGGGCYAKDRSTSKNRRSRDMAYTRKYRQGARVKSIEDFLNSPETQYFFWFGKTIHKQVFMHWQIDMLIRHIGRGVLYFADKNVPADGDSK